MLISMPHHQVKSEIKLVLQLAKELLQQHHLPQLMLRHSMMMSLYPPPGRLQKSLNLSQAKNNSRRNRGQTVVVDVESEDRPSRIPPNTRSKRKRASSNETLINCDLYINLEANSNSMRETANCVVSLQPPPPPPPPKEPTFNCPVCMGQLVEEMSTKCGHIFCKACIKAAIAAQNKCPTCRRRVTTKDIIRVYLPAASCS